MKLPSDLRLVTRATRLRVDQGNLARCKFCGNDIKFRAKVKATQIVVNVYQDGVWKEVNHYHEDCYAESGLDIAVVDKIH